MANYEATKYNFDGSDLTDIEGVNTGVIVPWSSSSVPSGFLECDGSNVSRSTYSALFAVIGTTYGSGDGSSTFTLPDLQDNCCVGKSNNKALASTMGANTVAQQGTLSTGNTTLSEAQIASHNHGNAASDSGVSRSQANPKGAKAGGSGNTGSTGQDGAHTHTSTFSGGSNSVVQPYITVIYIIKT